MNLAKTIFPVALLFYGCGNQVSPDSEEYISDMNKRRQKAIETIRSGAIENVELVEQTNSNNDAMLLYQSWRCAALAEFKNDSQEKLRLFRLGHKAGAKFLKPSVGQHEHNWNNIPITVYAHLPSNLPTEFQLGYLWRSIEQETYDLIVKYDENELILVYPSNWNVNPDYQKKRASILSKDSNCSLLN